MKSNGNLIVSESTASSRSLSWWSYHLIRPVTPWGMSCLFSNLLKDSKVSTRAQCHRVAKLCQSMFSRDTLKSNMQDSKVHPKRETPSLCSNGIDDDYRLTKRSVETVREIVAKLSTAFEIGKIRNRNSNRNTCTGWGRRWCQALEQGWLIIPQCSIFKLLRPSWNLEAQGRSFQRPGRSPHGLSHQWGQSYR